MPYATEERRLERLTVMVVRVRVGNLSHLCLPLHQLRTEALGYLLAVDLTFIHRSIRIVELTSYTNGPMREKMSYMHTERTADSWQAVRGDRLVKLATQRRERCPPMPLQFEA